MPSWGRLGIELCPFWNNSLKMLVQSKWKGNLSSFFWVYANTNIVELYNGEIKETILNPNELGIKAGKFENIIGKGPDYNSEKIREIFQGKDNDFSIAVCLNAAAGLIVADKSSSFKEGYTKLRDHILSGKVMAHMSKLQSW